MTLEDMSSKRFRIWSIAAIAAMVFLIILSRSQPERQANEIDTSCKRPYPDSSIWNVPLDWSIAKIHLMNDLMMKAFFKSRDWIGADTSQYTPNVYWVSNGTPLV